MTRTLINGGQATFTTGDLDRLVASHVTDDWSDVVDLVLREDRSIRLLTPDTETVLMTTARQQELTDEFVAIAREMMRETDPLFDRAILDQSVLEVEAELRQSKPGFVGFSDEQRRIFDGFERRLFVVQGDAGTGKTVLQRVQRRMAELQGRKPVAFATAQKAAKNIQIEAGIDAVNQARNIVHEELGKDYVRTAQAKGVTFQKILFGHVIRNALRPLVTILGLSFPYIFTGGVIVESVFNYPGLGWLMWRSALSQDYPILIAIVLVIGVLTVLGNLLADVVNGLLDPRARYE